MTQSRPTIQGDDLFELRVLHSATLSPDGTQLLFTVAQGDRARRAEGVTLWRLLVERPEPRPLSEGGARDSNPAWSPDGTQIAFLSNRDGPTQLYVMAAEAQSPRALTALPQGVSDGPVWSPDGAWLAFTAARPAPPPDAPFRLRRHVPRMDGLGLLDQAAEQLFVVPTAGGEPRALSDDARHHSTLRWSPDGRWLLAVAGLNPDTMRNFPQLLLVSLDGERRVLLDGWGSIDDVAWLPDGERLALLGQPAGRSAGAKNDVWLLSLAEGAPACRSAALPLGIGHYLQPDFSGSIVRSPRLVLTPDGLTAFVQVQVGGNSHIYSIALEGAERGTPVVTGERCAAPVGLVGGRLLFVSSTLHEPPNLALCNWDGSGERRLTELNAGWLAQRALPTLHALPATSRDGSAVDAWFLRPPSGEPPFPTVLYVHGGPHQGFGHLFNFDFHLLAGAGYGVLFANPRGSTGYGDAFAADIVGQWGGPDVADLNAVLDEAAARGWTDPARLAVAGLSYGGFMACWLAATSTRFCAAIAENPLTNWLSFYGTSDIGPRFAPDELGGLPHEIPDVYRRCSAISYAHQCRTPTLLIQSADDARCPPEQAEQFYRTLKANECPTELLYLPGAAHLGTIRGPVPARLAQNEALLEWLDRYMAR